MSYHRGHARGTRRQHHTASDWYKTIEAATLVGLEATWPHDCTPQQQETPIDVTTQFDSEPSVINDSMTPYTTARH
jgi:hypothetical protein